MLDILPITFVTREGMYRWIEKPTVLLVCPLGSRSVPNPLFKPADTLTR